MLLQVVNVIAVVATTILAKNRTNVCPFSRLDPLGTGVAMSIKIKRAYEPVSDSDGMRILVDRLWPRGVSKEKAKFDLWLKEIAPTTELRKWFGHDPDKWARFRGRYQTELRNNTDLVEMLADKAKHGTITLIYGARDEQHNEAVVLKQFLDARK